MMSETRYSEGRYKYWDGNVPKGSMSVVALRKRFIREHSRSESTNVFGPNPGRIYWAGGSWLWRDYASGDVYILKDTGYLGKNLGRLP